MESDNRKRLARAVVARRTELGLRTTTALAKLAKLSTRMLGDVENGRRSNFSPGAKAQIERALQWEPGSIDAILEGGDPMPLAQATAGVSVHPSVEMEARQGDTASAGSGRETRGLGRGLKFLVPTTDGMTPEEREQALEDERAVVESTWSAATEISESVLESDPSDRLRAATQRVVFLLSAQVITRILGSGYAPALESWLERVYRERQILHERLGDSPTPWVQDGISPEDAARSAVQTFGQWPAYFQPSSSGAADAPEGEEGDLPDNPEPPRYDRWRDGIDPREVEGGNQGPQ